MDQIHKYTDEEFDALLKSKKNDIHLVMQILTSNMISCLNTILNSVINTLNTREHPIYMTIHKFFSGINSVFRILQKIDQTVLVDILYPFFIENENTINVVCGTPDNIREVVELSDLYYFLVSDGGKHLNKLYKSVQKLYSSTIKSKDENTAGVKVIKMLRSRNDKKTMAKLVMQTFMDRKDLFNSVVYSATNIDNLNNNINDTNMNRVYVAFLVVQALRRPDMKDATRLPLVDSTFIDAMVDMLEEKSTEEYKNSEGHKAFLRALYEIPEDIKYKYSDMAYNVIPFNSIDKNVPIIDYLEPLFNTFLEETKLKDVVDDESYAYIISIIHSVAKLKRGVFTLKENNKHHFYNLNLAMAKLVILSKQYFKIKMLL